MPDLHPFPLPLQRNGPPEGFAYDGQTISSASNSSAFRAGLETRDQLLGEQRCVVCGISLVRQCLIIPDSESNTWRDLRARGWIPASAKVNSQHEPRNGLSLCPNHQVMFNRYRFFIRYLPKASKFIFVNYAGNSVHPMSSIEIAPYHGKAIALEVGQRYTPFPSLFIIHEMRARGFHPFAPVSPFVPDDAPWQDWIVSQGAVDSASGHLRHEAPPGGRFGGGGPQLPVLPTGTNERDTVPPPGMISLGLNADVINEILTATRSLPTWKACMIEGTNWEGSAEENIQKYVSSIGVEEEPEP
ncbi:hypothetical protein OE88DRAFT_1229372 [Heliocybe sulcata]|uniref:HNH nuclease domain-containing protein n=1 Tax=Heliocybe sulcata TaxID=5364 RepID=A0A5C3MIT7_9AGAM|nr:hypothetical protein OE88DRAFT_1229372 [Heliocybe sulcata]